MTGARLRKSAKGYISARQPASTNPLLTSSVRKGNSRYGRNPRRSMSETVPLARNGDRKVIVGGKIATKRIVDSTFSNTINEATIEELKVSRVEPQASSVEESKQLLHDCISSHCVDTSHCVDRHVNLSPRQHSYAEKVSKWLEDSEHSTLSELHDDISLLQDGELLIQPQADEDINDILHSLAIGFVSGSESVTDANGYDDTKPVAEPHSKDNNKTQLPVKTIERTKLRSLTKLLLRYMKIATCVSIIFLGLISQIRPESWEHYEPPPT